MHTLAGCDSERVLAAYSSSAEISVVFVLVSMPASSASPREHEDWSSVCAVWARGRDCGSWSQPGGDNMACGFL